MRYITLSFLLITIACSKPHNFSISEIEAPSGMNSSLPNLFTDNTGIVFMSWVETNDDSSTLFYSSLDDSIWSDAVSIRSSDTWFVNWADFPSVIARNGDIMAAHWLQKKKGSSYSYDVNISTAFERWGNVLTPHNDNTASEHGFVSMTPLSDSTFMAVWLDGRKTVRQSHGTASDLNSAMTLRSAVISNQLELLSEFEIDASVCDCCGTASVLTEDGLISVFRNRTEYEIRDIYTSKFKNGKWSSPKAVHNDNWEIAACPVNGPSISANEKTVAVTWFTAANDSAKVKLSFSNDFGDNFEPAIQIDDVNALGRVDVVVLDDKTAVVTWLERSPDNASIALYKLKQIDQKGNVIQSRVISEMASARTSGFPQLTKNGNQLIAAWTHINEDGSKQIKTSIIR